MLLPDNFRGRNRKSLINRVGTILKLHVMKNRIIYVFTFLLLTLVVISCSTENDQIDEVPIEATTGDDADLFIRIQPFPVVDLVISSYTTNVGPTTTGCGGVLPDVSCLGQRSFTATVTVTNNGPSALAAGSLSVDWTDTTTAGSSTQRQTINPYRNSGRWVDYNFKALLDGSLRMCATVYIFLTYLLCGGGSGEPDPGNKQ